MWTDACFIVGAVNDDIWTDLTNQLIKIGFYTALRERTVTGVLEDLHSHRVDLIFSEPELQDGTIFQLAQTISDDEPSLVVPLIMIGGDFSPSLLENASEAGVDFAVARPFQPEELEQTIRAALDRRPN